MKTASLGGPPPSRYYRFLSRVQSECDHPAKLAVLGCADGKFVLPAARRGLKVYAVDFDETAIHGGMKPGASGQIYMPGLVSRLQSEQLSHMVDITAGDFTKASPVGCDAVLTSGSIQYSRNSPLTAADILAAVVQHVNPGGLLYIDYMLPSEAKYVGRPNCPDQAWWRAWTSSLEGWSVIYNRVLPPVNDYPHVETPYPHTHHWGHLLARRGC